MVVERVADESASEEALDQESRAALSAWQCAVRNLPEWAHDARRGADLEALVRWYERTWNDSQFVERPPQPGLDALTDELTDPRTADFMNTPGLAERSG